jgi:large subunit ribosomal protein L25
MADKLSLKVEPRKVLGRKVSSLRREGILPGNIYGKGVKSLSIQLSSKEFKTIFAEAGETGIVTVDVAKETKTRPALVHNVHLDPVTGEFLHVDLHQVDLTKTVTVNIPIEVEGESPAEVQGGVLVQLLNEIEVEALPADLPDKFIVDATRLTEINQGVSLKDLKVDSKVKILSDNLEELVVKIEEPTKEVEPEAPVAEVAPEDEGAAKEGEEKPETETKKEDAGSKPENKKEATREEKKAEEK